MTEPAWRCGPDLVALVYELTNAGNRVEITRPDGDATCEACWFRGHIYGVQIAPVLRIETADDLKPIVEAMLERLEATRAEGALEARKTIADAWQYKAWFDVIDGDLPTRLGIGQKVTDWLRAQVKP